MKKRKEKKRYPYVPVEGIDNKYLDACLLSLLDGPALCKALSDEKSLIGKTNLTLTQILKQDVSKIDIVKEVSPLLSEHYSMYNYLAHVAHSRFHLIDEINKGEELNFVLWKENIEDAIKYGQITYFTYINWLRFESQGHAHLKAAFEKYGHLFEKDTGLTLSEDFNIVRSVEVDDMDEDPIEADFVEIYKRLQLLRKKVNQENYRAQYEELAEEKNELLDLNKSLQAELKALKDQLKSKDQSFAKKEKEMNRLKKDYESTKKKFEQKTKETGQLGGEVGKLRNEIEELTKQKNQFELEVTRLRSDRDVFQKEIENRLSNQWNSERALIKDVHQREMVKLQAESQAIKAQLEDKISNDSLQDEYENEISILNRQISIYTQQLKKMDEEHRLEISKLKKELALGKSTPPAEQAKPKKQEEDDFNLEDILGGLIENEPTPI